MMSSRYISFIFILSSFIIKVISLELNCVDLDLSEFNYLKYSDIIIEVGLLCFLKTEVDSTYLNSEIVTYLQEIRKLYNGKCKDPGMIESELIIYDRLDLKLDFPIGYRNYDDVLRGKILSCLIDDLLPRNTSSDLDKGNKIIVKNTIDYYSGLTLSSLRVLELEPLAEEDLEYIPGLKQLNYPSRSSLSIHEGSDRVLSGRQLFIDPYSSLDYFLNVFMSLLTRTHYVKEIAALGRIIRNGITIAETMTEGLQLSNTMLSFVQADKQFKDKTLTDIDRTLLQIKKENYESRAAQLMALQGILTNGLKTNELLVMMVGKLDTIIKNTEEIIDQLESINSELEKVNNQLDEINEQLEEINNTLNDISNQIDGLTGPPEDTGEFDHELGDHNTNDLMESNLISEYSDLMLIYEKLKCDDFQPMKELIQNVCFLYLFLNIRDGQVSDMEYARLRYDSTTFLNSSDHLGSCLMIGGNHPKFSSKYFSTNITLESDLEMMSKEIGKTHIKSSKMMLEFLYIDIVRGYNVNWFYDVFNLVRKNRGLNNENIDSRSVEDIIDFVSKLQSICR